MTTDQFDKKLNSPSFKRSIAASRAPVDADESAFKARFAARFGKPISAEDREANAKVDREMNKALDGLVRSLSPYTAESRTRTLAVKAGVRMASAALRKSMGAIEVDRQRIRDRFARLDGGVEALAADVVPLLAQHKAEAARRSAFPRPPEAPKLVTRAISN
jgi:hypothetical protein